MLCILLKLLDIENAGITYAITMITVIFSIISLFLFVYENRKRQKNIKDSRIIYNVLNKEFEHLKLEHDKLNIKEQILSQIINCANKALENEESFQGSMRELVNTLRMTFKSEYCAIGKITRNIVEDYACDYDEYHEYELQYRQKDGFNEARKVNINNSEYMVCEALKNKKEQISHYNEDNINRKQNEHFKYYKDVILKSRNISNTTIIPLRDSNLNNFGYIQFINIDKVISIEDVAPFLSGLLQLVQMVIKKEEDKKKLEDNKRFIDDSNFIKKIITQKDTVDNLLDTIMEYLSAEFRAAVISFRIPILNGKEKEPLFYLRRCYINPLIHNSKQIQDFYYSNRIIKKQTELGGYNKLKCCNNGSIILENIMDTNYYSIFNLDLKKQTLIMPVLKDIGKYGCIKIENDPFCQYDENPECIDRFKKLYGLFKLRLFKNEEQQDIDIAMQEDATFMEESQKRLSYLSGQITLILNSIVDKSENESLKIFRESIKSQQFLKIRDFDKQFVEVIKKSTHAKECSIYRYRKDEDYSEQIYLSATTSNEIQYKRVTYPVEDVIGKLKYSISDDASVIVSTYNRKETRYLYNLRGDIKIGDFIEVIDTPNSVILDESVFLVPIIKKDEEKTCLGVVVLFGKQANIHDISTSYWEQDKGLVEFIVEIFTRISEADNERLTFLSQLRHELLTPITELVQENDFLFNRFEMRKDNFDKKEIFSQLKKNIDHCFLFQHIIADIEHIYSSSIKDSVFKIELLNEPWKILYDVIDLFKSTIPIKTAISDMPPIYMDKYKIKQVFINIIKNAVRYSYQGQPIEIYYKQTIEGGIKYHEIKFVNYGIGILEEDKDKIFELYKRGKNAAERRASGSGMGLYIVNEIMRAHGGDCIIRKLKDPTEISLLFPVK